MNNNITEEIGRVVAAMRPLDISYGQPMLDAFASNSANFPNMPFYMFGHRLEMSNRITLQESSKTLKLQKYPLVALKLDTIETVRGGMIDYNLNLAIINLTDQKWTSAERKVNVFIPILYPLYTEFMEQIRKVGKFYWDMSLQKFPPHEKVDRYFYGTLDVEGNKKNLFNDPIDAIEILNLKVSQVIKNKNC